MRDVQIGTGAIKGMNIKDGDELGQLAQEKDYNNFLDLYIDIIEKTSLTKSKVISLIKLECFSEFGNINKLISIVEFYEKYKTRKTLKKDQLDESPFTKSQVLRFSEKETAKQFSGVDMKGLIADSIDSIGVDEKTPKISVPTFEGELLGMPFTTLIDSPNTEFQDSLALVYLVEKPRWAWGDSIVSIFRLHSGDREVYRVYENVRRENSIEEGDVIQTLTCKENKTRGGFKENILASWHRLKF